MINMQNTLNELYYTHGYKSDSYYSYDNYRAELEPTNKENQMRNFYILYPNVGNCDYVTLVITSAFDGEIIKKQNYKTQKGLIRRILNEQTKQL